MPQKVPFLDLSRPLAKLQGTILEALARVVESGCFVLGPEIQRLEDSLAAYVDVPHAVACASGSEALLLALMALDVQPGDEVIVPSFTFFATASAVSRLGATPVFADICADSFCLDPEDVERKISPKTRAVVPVHLFGQAADLERLCAVARSRNVAVVEDAAQSIGAKAALGARNVPVGGIGDVGCFSFYPTKNLGAMGDGGAVTTRSDALAEKLRLLRCHGMAPRYYHQMVGINARLDAFQGAVLNAKFPHLAAWTQERERLAQRYATLFAEFFGKNGENGENAGCAPGFPHPIILPKCVPGTRHVWNQYSVRIPGGCRDAVREFMAAQGVGTEIYYPLGLHEQPCFAYLGWAADALPVTHRVCREILALPIFPGLTEAEQTCVVETLRDALRHVTCRCDHAPARVGG